MENTSEHSISPIVGFDDFEAGLAMMTEVMGFEVAAMMRDETGTAVHCELRWGNAFVMPSPRNEKADSPWMTGPASLYLTTDDPDKLFSRCQDAGLEVVMPLTDQPYGSRDFGVRDASNNIWMFGTYRPGSSS